MSAPIVLRCEHCGVTLRLAAGRLRPGATASCPRCRRSIRLSAPAQSAGFDEIQCQTCGALLRVRADRRPAAGATARCPRCQSAVPIPPLPGATDSRPAAAPPKPQPPVAAPAAGPFANPPFESDMLPPAGISPAPRGAAPASGLGAGESPAPAKWTPAAAPSRLPGEEPRRAPSEAGPDPAPAARRRAAPATLGAEEEPVIEIQGDEEENPPPAPAQPAAPRAPAAPGSPPNFWTVEIGGETLHPTGVSMLRLWARQGKLRSEDRVQRGEGRWQLAREIPELASIFARQRAGKPEPEALAKGSTREGRNGLLAGVLGGAAALVPVLGLLIFMGELERISASWEIGLGLCALLLGAGIVATGALVGRTLAALQSYYEGHGEAANIWSASGASAVGVAAGLLCGLAAFSFWPPVGGVAMVAGFSAYGACVALLVLVSYRALFVERRA